MKNSLAALLCSILPALATLHAQSVSTVPPVSPTVVPVTAGEREEVVGTITDVTAGRSLVLHTGTNAGEPVVFRFAHEVTYVDDEGKIIEAAGLRKNMRVRVSYIKGGGFNVVDKVTTLQ